MVENNQNISVKQKITSAINTGRRAVAGGVRSQYNYKQENSIFVENIAEKRYLWTARAFAVISAISICCNIVLLLTINQIMPLFRIEPFLLTFQDKTEQIVNVRPVDQNLEDQKTITETFVRKYVLIRSTFTRDISEMEARWMPDGPVQEMSTPAVYKDFLQNTAKRAVDIIRKEGLVREVKILSVNELSRGLWQVEYETRDMRPDSTEPDINYWTASLRIRYLRKRLNFEERYKNPVGFTVIRYALSHNNVDN